MLAINFNNKHLPNKEDENYYDLIIKYIQTFHDNIDNDILFQLYEYYKINIEKIDVKVRTDLEKSDPLYNYLKYQNDYDDIIINFFLDNDIKKQIYRQFFLDKGKKIPLKLQLKIESDGGYKNIFRLFNHCY